jgi:diacylglycerol kinase family enzyme
MSASSPALIAPCRSILPDVIGDGYSATATARLNAVFGTSLAIGRFSPMRAHAIVNSRAGTALDLDPGEIEGRIADAFRAAGHSATVECVAPEKLAGAIKAAVRSDIEALIVGGGDGTVRAAAEALVGTDKALGIIPLGTLNRLARDLNMPLDAGEAIKALAAGRTRSIDVAYVNDYIFLCNSMFGLLPRFAAQRQALRGEAVLVRLKGYVRTIWQMLARTRTISISVEDGEEIRRLRALTVAVTSNEYDESPSLMLVRPRLDGGYLTLYASKHKSGWALFAALLRAMAGRWRDDPYVVKITGTAFTIHMPRRFIHVTNDGEVEKLRTPLRYIVRRRALRVLTPPAQEPPATS